MKSNAPSTHPDVTQRDPTSKNCHYNSQWKDFGGKLDSNLHHLCNGNLCNGYSTNSICHLFPSQVFIEHTDRSRLHSELLADVHPTRSWAGTNVACPSLGSGNTGGGGGGVEEDEDDACKHRLLRLPQQQDTTTSLLQLHRKRI